MSRAPMMTPSVCLQPRPGDRPRPKGSANAGMRTKSTPTPVTIHANTGLLIVASFVSTQSPDPLAARVTGGLHAFPTSSRSHQRRSSAAAPVKPFLGQSSSLPLEERRHGHPPETQRASGKARRYRYGYEDRGVV